MPESPRRDRPGETPGRAASLGDFLVCLIVTAAWTARALPGLLTHLRDAYDAQFQAWEIAWVRHAIVHAPAHIFDANIFAPARNALAFTEPLIGYGLLGLPLGLAGLLAHAGVFNVLCLLGTAFSVWATSRLAVSHGVPRVPALLGAVAAALGAQTACAFGYVSFVVAGGIALVLVAWKRLRESGRWLRELRAPSESGARRDSRLGEDPRGHALSARGLARERSRRPRARASPRPAPADDGARSGGPSGRRSRRAAPVRHRGGDDWVFFLRRASARRPAPAADGGAAEKDEVLFLEHVAAAPRFERFDDTQFPASIDEPEGGQVVHGELKVRGWSQTPGAPGEIVEIRIDRDRRARASFARAPRPDVAAVLPALGSCAEAGYEAQFPMLPGDDGAHDLHVLFRSADGRMRTISRTFEWVP